MKFCFILTQDLESPSGLGRYYPWAKELINLGHSVNIIALHSDYYALSFKQEITIEKIKVKYVSQMHVKKRGDGKEYFSFYKLIWIVILATIKLSFASLKTRADIYIIGKAHPMNSIAGLVCKMINKPMLIVDCDDDETNSGNFRGWWQKSIIRFFEKNIPGITDLVTTNTKYTLQRLINDGVSSDKIYYLTNGVDPDRFTNIDRNHLDNLRNKLGISLETKVIGYIGSMSLSNHAIILLIDAFEIVIKSKKDISLIMVGGGEDFDYLKSYVNKKGLEKNVVFTGRISPDNIKYYYSIAALTIDPVNDDIAATARSPIKIYESWICGTPVLSSPIGDRRQLISQDKNGFLGDGPHQYSEYILNFFEKDRSYMQKNCKNSAKKYYWKKLIIDINDQILSKMK